MPTPIRRLRHQYRSVTLRHRVVHYAAPGQENPGRARTMLTRNSTTHQVEYLLSRLRPGQVNQVTEYIRRSTLR